MKNDRPKQGSAKDLLSKLQIDVESSMPLADEDLPYGCSHEELVQALQTRFQALRRRQCFQPGDLVTWKPGLRNRRYPVDGRPAIVLQVLTEPVFDEELNSGSNYFREPLDLVLGLVLEEGEQRGNLLAWHFDSRRFEHWK